MAKRLGWRTAEDNERAGWKALREFLVDRAVERDVPSVLFRLAVEHLSSDEVRIIRPGVVSLMEEIATAREEAGKEVYRRVELLLTGHRLADLDGILEVEPEMAFTRITWLHRGSTSYSPTAIKGEVDKVLFLRGLEVHSLDLSMVPESRRRQLAGMGRRLRTQALKGRSSIASTRSCSRRWLNATSRSSTRSWACSTKPCRESRAAPRARSKRSWRNGARRMRTSWTCWRRCWSLPPIWRFLSMSEVVCTGDLGFPG